LLFCNSGNSNAVTFGNDQRPHFTSIIGTNSHDYCSDSPGTNGNAYGSTSPFSLICSTSIIGTSSHEYCSDSPGTNGNRTNRRTSPFSLGFDVETCV
jgi:hypothetical protein